MNAISPILIAALIAVESGGNDRAIGAQGERGCLQISDRCLEDVNRIQNLVHFTADSCFDRETSVLIFETYVTHYLGEKVDAGTAGWREIAMLWHRGPHGIHFPDTDHYWAKVQQYLVSEPVAL